MNGVSRYNTNFFLHLPKDPLREITRHLSDRDLANFSSTCKTLGENPGLIAEYDGRYAEYVVWRDEKRANALLRAGFPNLTMQQAGGFVKEFKSFQLQLKEAFQKITQQDAVIEVEEIISQEIPDMSVLMKKGDWTFLHIKKAMLRQEFILALLRCSPEDQSSIPCLGELENFLSDLEFTPIYEPYIDEGSERVHLSETAIFKCRLMAEYAAVEYSSSKKEALGFEIKRLENYYLKQSKYHCGKNQEDVMSHFLANGFMAIQKIRDSGLVINDLCSDLSKVAELNLSQFSAFSQLPKNKIPDSTPTKTPPKNNEICTIS